MTRLLVRAGGWNVAVTEAERAARIDACRKQFREAGLPLFDEDFSASTNVFNRAAPLLVLVFAAEMFGAIKLDWSIWANLGAVAAGIAILLAVGALINRWRGRRWNSMPRHVGRVEQAAFVIVPALLPLIFGGQTRSAWVTALGNLLLLVLIYAVLGYGLTSILGWALRRITRQLMASFALLARAVPLLLIFALLIFLTTEMWEVFTLIADADLILVGVLFVGLGTAFLFARLPQEVRMLESDVSDAPTPLGKRQRRNVGLVLFTSQALQVLIVTLMIAAFFIVFGGIAVTEELRERWTGEGSDVLAEFDLLGEPFQISVELLKVTAGIAAFTGLYFAIAMLTDSTYREEFLDEVTGELREVFRVREEYLRLRSGG
jgi:hypothetical protein